MAKFLWLLFVASSPVALQAAEMTVSTTSHANPIRKVVTMLQNMAKKVEEEGKKEQVLFDKFMCACKTNGGDLSASIADAKTRIPDLESSIEASVGKKAQLEKDLEGHKADKAAANTAMAEATGVRNKDEAAFKKEFAEGQAETQTMSKALASLEGGLGGAFLQTNSAASLRKIVMTQEDMEDADKQVVLSFLEGKQSESAPGTETVIGILKTMKEEAAKGLSEAEAAETEAVANYDALMSAKKKEVKAATKMTEEKLQRNGQIATEIETLKNELEDTKDRLAEDEKMKATLEKSCATKGAEHEKSQALRQEEVVALSDTIKVLNDDDALDLFKKTLPSASASFLQIQVSAHAVRSRALNILRSEKHRSVQADFIALALRGKKVGFDGVIKMIGELSSTLQAEQAADDKKKVYCNEEFDKSDDKKKSLERSISDTKSAIGKAEEDIASLGEAIGKLTSSIQKLDKSVAAATSQRKEEHSDYSELMASDGTAKELLGFAKNRLNKFYNPKLYKAPPKRELSDEDRAQLAGGGTLAPTAAPGGIAGTGIGFVQVEAHTTVHTVKANGVIRMIDLLIADLDKEMTEAEVEEKDAQADYEQAMKDAQSKRATDSKALAESESEKADAESSLEELTAAKKSATKELMATEKYISALHSDCDWLLQYFDVRKEARSSEVDSLTKAKAVLSGADYSFLQLGSTRTRKFLEHA